MSLEEKFLELELDLCECPYNGMDEVLAGQCVQICDEFAVGFQNWIEDTIQTDPKKYINLTTWELLEIYKQGL